VAQLLRDESKESGADGCGDCDRETDCAAGNIEAAGAGCEVSDNHRNQHRANCTADPVQQLNGDQKR